MTGRPFWEAGWFWLLLAVVSTLPFVIAPMPLMPDHFAHAARYHVMNHGAESPFLRRYFSFEWGLIGNLGVDLLMVPLGRLLPTEPAATLAAATIPPLTVAGIWALARAVHGRVPATALLALTVIYSFTFLYGFENYHMSVALGLLCAAAWIRLADGPGWRRWLLMAPFSLLVLVAHIAGWGGMGLIIAGWEWSRMQHRRPMARLGRMIWRMLPLAAPVVLLVLFRPRSDGEAAPSVFHPVWLKLRHFYELFKGEYFWVDAGLLAVTAGLVLWMIGRLRAPDNRSEANPAMLTALALLTIVWLAMPFSALSSFYADQRMLVMMVVVFALALPVWNRPQARVVALVAVALFGVRVAEIGIGWRVRGAVIEAELAALDQVPRGARIASASVQSVCPWPLMGRFDHLFQPLHGHDHLANFAIVRREAFANTQWDVAGGQLMRPIYNLGQGYNDSSSARFGTPVGRCQGHPIEALVDGIPRDRFDFVWTFDAPISRPWLKLVFTGPHGRLYRIIRE